MAIATSTMQYNDNGEAKYSAQDLKDGYTTSNICLLNVCLKKKDSLLKLLNIFKYHIVTKPGPTVVDYDEWSLSNALWMKFYNGHGTYKPKLNDCFQIYWR